MATDKSEKLVTAELKASETLLEEDESIDDFEDVLGKIGGFGKFQFLILVLLLSLEIPAAFLAFISVFVGVPPKEWDCILDDGTSLRIFDTETCSCNGTLRPVGTESIVTEWGLICEQAWVSDFITSFQMFGMLIGNIYGGTFSDWYGRKQTCIGACFLMAMGQGMSAVAPNPYIYAAARFVAGLGFSGFLGISAVYTMEFHSTKYRQLCGSVGPWGEGLMLMGLLAYLVRPWRILTWITTAPNVLILFVYLFVPESPRWLMRRNRIDEAYQVVQKMARMNGKDPRCITQQQLQRVADREMKTQDVADDENCNVSRSRMTYMDLIRNPELRMTSFYLMFIWFSWATTYFGISYNIRNMAGDPYWNVFFLGLTDALGYPAGLLFANRLGRRKSVAVFMTWAAVFLVGLALLDIFAGLTTYPVLLLVLCLIGKFGISVVRACARTLTGESYPTACRSMGSGLCGIAASTGAMMAPQLAFLGSYWPSIPFFFFASISVAGAFVSFLLSETMGRPMREGSALARQHPSLKTATLSEKI